MLTRSPSQSTELSQPVELGPVSNILLAGVLGTILTVLVAGVCYVAFLAVAALIMLVNYDPHRSVRFNVKVDDLRFISENDNRDIERGDTFRISDHGRTLFQTDRGFFTIDSIHSGTDPFQLGFPIIIVQKTKVFDREHKTIYLFRTIGGYQKIAEFSFQGNSYRIANVRGDSRKELIIAEFLLTESDSAIDQNSEFLNLTIFQFQNREFEKMGEINLRNPSHILRQQLVVSMKNIWKGVPENEHQNQ